METISIQSFVGNDLLSVNLGNVAKTLCMKTRAIRKEKLMPSRILGIPFSLKQVVSPYPRSMVFSPFQMIIQN